MEEILASIRRIIADDDASKSAKPPEPAPHPTAALPAMNQAAVDAMLADLDGPAKAVRAPTNDILDLTEAQATPVPGPAPNFRTIEGESDVVFSNRAPDTPSEPVGRTVDEARRQFVQSAPDRGLLSSATAAAVDSAFNSLANTVLGNNARTLEDLVKEMLRPMLKAWLDDNLPGLVERIVRAEIERVARGRP
jgi:cell pole-organizing protein PopZ